MVVIKKGKIERLYTLYCEIKLSLVKVDIWIIT